VGCLALAAMLGCAGCASPTTNRPLDQAASAGRPSAEPSLPAALRPAPNSPRVCSDIAGTPATRDVNQAVIALASGDAAAVGRLNDAAAGLRALAGTAPDAQLRAALAQAAKAAAALTQAGPSDQAALAPMGDALTKLGKELQERCHYPVG